MQKKDLENNLLTPEEIQEAKKYIQEYIQDTCLYIPDPNVIYHPSFPKGRIPSKITGNPGGMGFLFLLRRVLYNPRVANTLYLLLIDKIIDLRKQGILPEDFQIGGVESSSIALLAGLQQTMLMLGMKAPNIITVKKDRKPEGLFQFADGEIGSGPIIFIDDIIHSGGSFLRFADIVEYELNLKLIPICLCILTFIEDDCPKLIINLENEETEEYKVETFFNLHDFDYSYNPEMEETLGDDVLWKKYSGWKDTALLQ